jgi:PTS system galactitol-specific IIA component
MPELNLLNPELIKMDMEAKNKEEVIKELANLLISKGYVKESYLEAILERERAFPTGLPTDGVGVAIPHADIKHVLKPGIAIAILKNAVKFNVMGNPDEEVNVKLVFMLAIKEPNMQINLLKNLVTIFQDKKLLLMLTNISNKNSVISLLNSAINMDNSNQSSLHESIN